MFLLVHIEFFSVFSQSITSDTVQIKNIILIFLIVYYVFADIEFFSVFSQNITLDTVQIKKIILIFLIVYYVFADNKLNKIMTFLFFKLTRITKQENLGLELSEERNEIFGKLTIKVRLGLSRRK